MMTPSELLRGTSSPDSYTRTAEKENPSSSQTATVDAKSPPEIAKKSYSTAEVPTVYEREANGPAGCVI